MGTAREEAVRCYLVMVNDPSWPVAVPEYARLQRELDQTDDPLERVRLHARLRELERVLTDRGEAGFVACAKEWAEANGVTADALRGEGVPDAVLRRAGFALREDRVREKPKGSGTRRSPTTSEIRAALPPGRFTVDDVQLRIQASRGAVRRVVRLMLQRGELEELCSAEGSARAGVYRRIR